MKPSEEQRNTVKYWTFYNNPGKWQFDRFLESGESETQYLISPNWHQDAMKAGQLGVVRVGKDSRNKEILGGKPKLESGVYAIVMILTDPYPRSVIDPEHWLVPRDHIIGEPGVRLKILKNLLQKPILIEDIKELPSLIEDVHLLNAMQARTMPLSAEAFAEIEHLAGGIGTTLIEDVVGREELDLDKLKELDTKYMDAAPEVKMVLSKVIERGPIGNLVKKIANYECQVCKAMGADPLGFKLRGKEINYIEAHHVSEVCKKEVGSLVSNNVLAVCPLHHRQIHYGNVKVVGSDDYYYQFIFDESAVQIKRNHY